VTAAGAGVAGAGGFGAGAERRGCDFGLTTTGGGSGDSACSARSHALRMSYALRGLLSTRAALPSAVLLSLSAAAPPATVKRTAKRDASTLGWLLPTGSRPRGTTGRHRAAALRA
jgi:hypothetical protein